MNKKEREQLLRDTLEQGLSALDSLPSDRAEVNRRLAENAPDIKHRIRFRRLAVPAVALALCVCLIITGTQLGMIPWPDRIRPQEIQVTTPPVLLAQPVGEGTGTPGSPAGEELVPFSSLPAEAREETENLFAGFFNAWKTGSMDKMLELCSPLWVSAQENPKLALFSILLNRTPSDFIIESISGTPLDTDRMVSAIVTMNYNNNKPETDFRLNVRMIREKSAWYIDPESLVSYKRIIEEAPFDPVARLRELNADCPADFVPVGLSCEKEGFRLELVSASVNEQSAFLIWSLQDLEGDHPDFICDDVSLISTYPWPYLPSSSDSLLYDASSRTLWFATVYQAGAPYDAGEVLIDGLPQYLAELTTLYFRHVESLSIGGLFEKYRSRAALVDVPELITTYYRDDDGNTLAYDTSWYRERGIRVLDYTHPLSVRLHKNLELSGVGLIDGQLHVQLHYVDDSPVTYGAVYYIPVVNAIAYIPSGSSADSIPDIPEMLWDTDGDEQVDYIEYVYPCESEEEARKLKVSFLETTGAVEGNWTIKIPLEKVWTGNPDADFLKAKAPEDIESWITQFFGAWELGEYNYMLDNCSPSWVSAQENPRQALFGNILVNRVPSSVTVESVSGSDEDAERMVTVLASMDYHNNKPDVETQLNVRIVREDGAWYVDPNSLVSHKVITTPVPEVEPAVISLPDDSGFLPCENPRSLDQIPLDLLLSLRPDLKDDLFPVNQYWTNGGPVRLEVISAAVGETESWVIYTIENGMPRDQCDLANGLDDSPLPESDITEHYMLGRVPALNETRFAARIRHSTPDPERKSVVFSVSDIDIVMRESIDNMKSLFLIYEPLSGGLADLPKSADSFSIITKSGEDLTPGEFRKSGQKVLDSTHSPNKYLSNGLELSGIGLEEDGMLHIQLHTVERKTGTIDGISYAQLYSWYLHIDYKVTDRGYSLTWPDPEAVGDQTYFEYIIPWTMEDFDRYSLRLDLFEKWSELPDPVTLDISRPE